MRKALKIDEQATADPARDPGRDGSRRPGRSCRAEVIDAASPEAAGRPQLGTLFRRMLSYGAATSALLDAAALDTHFSVQAIASLGVFEPADSFCLADIGESTGASMPAVSRTIDTLVRKASFPGSRIPRPAPPADRAHRRRPPGHQRRPDGPCGRRGETGRQFQRGRTQSPRLPALEADRAGRPCPQFTGGWKGSSAVSKYQHLITDENRKWWTLGAMLPGPVHGDARQHRRQRRPPSIQRDLGTSISGLEWIVNGYTLSFAVLLAVGGGSVTSSAAAAFTTFGVVIFTVASATAGFAPSNFALVAAACFRASAPLSDARLSFDHHRRLPGPQARQGDRDLNRGFGSGPGSRPSGPRRLPGRACLLARDFHINPCRSGFRRARRDLRGPQVARHHGRPGRLPGSASSPSLTSLWSRPDRRRNTWGWDSTAVISLIAVSIIIGPDHLHLHREPGHGTDHRVRALQEPELHRLGGGRLHHLPSR